MTDSIPHYSIIIIIIEWSDEDQAYVVILPEWVEQYAMPVASSQTYEEAAARGRNALENSMQFAREDGKPVPLPRAFASSAS